MHRAPSLATLALVAVASLAACSGPAAPPSASASPSASAAPSAPAGGLDALAGTWRLVAIDDAAVAPEPVRSLTIKLDGSVDGHGGCNGFGGDVSVDGQGLGFGPLISTKMACVDGQVQEVEDRFLAALGTSVGYAFGDAGELVIEGPDGRLTFVAGG